MQPRSDSRQFQRDLQTSRQKLSPVSSHEPSTNLSITRSEPFYRPKIVMLPKGFDYGFTPREEKKDVNPHLSLGTTPKSLRERTPRPEKTISSISDFFNNSQISEAIQRPRSLSNRLKTLDLIIQRRTELKELEAQVREDRALPLIRKLQQNFRKKRLQKILAQNKKQADLEPHLRPGIDDLYFKASGYKTNVSAAPDSRILNSTEHSGKLTGEISINPDDSRAITLSNLDDPLEAKKKFDHFAEKLKLFLTRNGASEKHLEDETEGAHSHTKNTRKSNKNENLSMEDYHFASKTLEKDLFKFIIKNKSKKHTSRLKDNSADLFFEKAGVGNEKLKHIEDQVQKKLENYQRDEHRCKSFFRAVNSKLGVNQPRTRIQEPTFLQEPVAGRCTLNKSSSIPSLLDRNSSSLRRLDRNKHSTIILTNLADDFELFMKSQE